MKYILLISGLFILVILVAKSYNKKYTLTNESHNYQVIQKHNSFEIRNYSPGLFAYVNSDTNSYKAFSREGFKTLAGYIFGYNENNQKLAMTTPVSVTLNDTMSMMFFISSNYKLEDLPKPLNKNIKLKKEGEKKVASIKFNGWANDKRIAKYKNKLIHLLKKKGINYHNQFRFLGYNPPYEIFNRRNEIIVVLDN